LDIVIKCCFNCASGSGLILKIKTKGTEEVQGEVYYISKPLVNKIITEEYEILAEMKGKDMEFMEYEQLMPYVQVDKNAVFYYMCSIM